MTSTILLLGFLGAAALVVGVSWTLGTRFAEHMADKVTVKYVRKNLDDDLKGAAHV